VGVEVIAKAPEAFVEKAPPASLPKGGELWAPSFVNK